MQCSDSDVIRYGLDQGINYIDTADCYMGGRNEKIVGRAVEGIRDRVYIATKVHMANEQRMRASVERSLRSLNTETIDVMQLHGVSSGAHVADQRIQEIMEKMKQEGKFRFAGVTTHSNQGTVINAVIEDGFYDTVLVAYNFRSPETLADSIATAGQSGIGIIGMKTQNGGFRGSPFADLSPHQAALRFVLEKSGMACAVPGMLNRKMVEENLGVLNNHGGLADLFTLEAYRADLEGKACSFCSQCLDQCRYGTGGVDAARVAMYREGYQDARLAAENALAAADAIGNCANCEECTVTCSQGIDIKAAARKAVRYLA